MIKRIWRKRIECGAGKVQRAPFRIQQEPKQPQLQFWGLHWEPAIFIRPAALSVLQKEKIQVGCIPVEMHKTNSPVEGLQQLQPPILRAKSFDPYNALMLHCPSCGRKKWEHPVIGGYCFDESVFDSRLDIVETMELFGSGASAERLTIVSKKFRDLFGQQQWKGLQFIPLQHERYGR